jgi:hypothetical protein
MNFLHRPIAPVEAALIAQVCTKSDVVWVRGVLQERHHLVWHVWHDDSICIVSGPGEQELPPPGDTVEVVARSKETGARVVTFLARARTLEPRSPEWEAAAHDLSAARLNQADTSDQLQRWAQHCSIVQVRPVNVTNAVSGDDASPDGRTQPPRGPGTTLNRTPFHLSRRTRRAQRQQRSPEQ